MVVKGLAWWKGWCGGNEVWFGDGWKLDDEVV